MNFSWFPCCLHFAHHFGVAVVVKPCFIYFSLNLSSLLYYSNTMTTGYTYKIHMAEHAATERVGRVTHAFKIYFLLRLSDSGTGIAVGCQCCFQELCR
jgi:hypothetical protein